MLNITIINCDDKFVEFGWDSIKDFLKDMKSDKENIPMLDDTVISIDTENESYGEEECRYRGIYDVDDVVEWCRQKNSKKGCLNRSLAEN